MICRDRNIVFVHIPKCGGTSVEDCVWPLPDQRTEEMLWMGFKKPYFNKYQTGGLQHLTARFIRAEIGPALFGRCFKFAICRHPLARLVSQFRYMSQRPDLREFAGLAAEHDFDDYLDRIVARAHVQWLPQAEFLLDDDGTMLVDRLYRFENIIRDARALSDDLGLGIDALPHKNATEGAAMPVLSARHKARVHEMYRTDFELLGYAL